MKTKHDWQSVNRGVHEPQDLTLNDLFEEIRCAVSESDVLTLAFLLDDGDYKGFGVKMGLVLKHMGGRPANKIAARKKA